MSNESPNMTPEYLIAALIAWINIKTWEESQEFLKAHAEQFLTKEALKVFDTLLAEDGDDEEEDEHREIIQLHQAILEKALAESIDAAYAPLLQSSPPPIDTQSVPEAFRDAIQAMVDTRSPADLLTQLDHYSILLTQEAFAAIDAFIETLHQAGQDAFARYIDERYDTLKRVREQIELARQPIPDDIVGLILEWLHTDTWNESKAFLVTHAERLLKDEVHTALDVLIARNASKDNDSLNTLLRHKAILSKALATSIDEAYTDLLKPSPVSQAIQGLSDELRAGIQAMINVKSSSELVEQIEEHPILLTPQATAALDTLLDALRQQGEENTAEHIAECYATLKEIIELNQNPILKVLNALLGAKPGTLEQIISQHTILLNDEMLQELDKYVTQTERAEDMVLAQGLRLRIDEVRRIRQRREHASNQQPADYRDDEASEPLRERDAGQNNIIVDHNDGNITQNNMENVNLALPPQKWQPPVHPSLAKTFIGRQEQLQELQNYLIAGMDVATSGKPTATMLHGMAGIGKTYLATQLAIEVQSHFPGGVITIKLGERVTSEEAAQEQLRELAGYVYEPQALQFINRFQPEQVARWLQNMAPGRLLVIFDDVWDSEPLLFLTQALPPDAVRIITTRDATIAQAISAKDVVLERLSDEDGIALLEDRLGCRGNMLYRGTLQELVKLLGGHALALDIIAARIKQPERLQDIVKALLQGVGQSQLDQLKLRGKQNRDTSLEKSLALSYLYMTEEEQHRFRLLGVFEAETPISVEAAAAMWNMDDLTLAQSALFDLVDLAMLETAGSTYRQHGLLRVYGYALLDNKGELNSAQWAHAEHYRSLALHAETATPKDYPLLDQHMKNLQAALEWTDAHEPLLFSQLVEILDQFLRLRGQIEKLKVYLPKAKDIAAATGYWARQANLLQSLGDLESRLGNIEQARAHYDAALPLYQREQARLGEANIYMSVADVLLSQQQWQQAKAYYEQALPLFAAERDPLGQANTLIDLGLARFELGEHESGLDDIQKAAALFHAVQDEIWTQRAEQRVAELRLRLEHPQENAQVLEAFLAVRSSQELYDLVQQYPQLLTDEWFATVEGLSATQSDEQIKEAFVERLRGLKHIKQTLEQNAVAASQVTDLLIDFIRADWNTRRHLLTEHAGVLLSESVEPLFTMLKGANEDESVQQTLEDMRTLLHQCRQWDVDIVFYFKLHMRTGDDIDIPSAYEAPLMQAATLLSHQEKDQAIPMLETILNRLTAAAPALFEAALLRDLAETQHALPANHPARKLTQIEMCYREALPIYQATHRPVSVAFIQRSLGNILNEQGRYDEALVPLQAASESLQAQEHTKDDAAWALSAYASALDNLGQTDAALTAYAQAIVLLPTMPPLLRNRAEVLIHARRLNEVETDLTRSIELDGNENSPYLWFRRAQLAIARGDGPQAEHMLNEVVERNPAEDIVFLRAQSAWLQGNVPAAQEGLQLAFSRASAGELLAMRRELQRLLSEHPDLPNQAELIRM